MRRLSNLILRHLKWLGWFGTALAIIGSYFSVLLYKNLRTDIEELLPQTARSVVDLNEITKRLESVDNLVILTFSEDTKASKRFVTDLGRRLEKIPKDTVASVEYRIDGVLKFFEDRKALYADLADLQAARDFMKKRIRYEKAVRNPVGLVDAKDLKKPTFDFEGMKNKYQAKNPYGHLPDGFYATEDETIRAIFVFIPGKASDIHQAHRLRAAVDEAVAELNPKSYASDLQVRYTGNVENLIEEHAALIADLEISTLVVVLLVMLSLIWFYRSLSASMALCASLFGGALWTFGVAYFMVGYLNANSAFLASIIVGNGINFGVIFVARFIEERKRGMRALRAVKISMVRTAPSTLTAALAAGVSYGSLILTSFQGFSQFGVIGLVGMVLCWTSAYTLLPAYLLFMDSKGWLPMPKASVIEGKWANAVAVAVERRPGLIWGVSVGMIALSLLSFINFRSEVLETDMDKLRDRESMRHGSGSIYHYVVEIAKRSPSPIVVLPKTRSQAVLAGKLYQEQKARDGADSLLGDVKTLDDFIPKDQAEKRALLADMRGMLTPTIRKNLPKDQLKELDLFLGGKTNETITQEKLPKMILDRFREKDGSVGKLVLIDKRLGSGEKVETLLSFMSTLRGVADKVASGTAIAGQILITGDMVKAIREDGPRATLFSFLAVVLLVAIVFRNVKTVVRVLMALGIGILWLAGLILGLDLKINFLNFIALPITFGIGVDYGVNIFQRYREEGAGSILNVIRHTGGAVGLASLTTIIGYGSLLIAGNQAFVSFGLLAILGEITCVTAAVLSLPAYLRYRDQRRSRPPSVLDGGGDHSEIFEVEEKRNEVVAARARQNDI